MSALLALVGSLEAREAVATAMLNALAPWGTERISVWRHDDVTLARGAFAWEESPDITGTARVVADDRFVVVADASLYYRADLHRALSAAGHPTDETDPTALIHRAWIAWGAHCVEHLEGDYAFVVWDCRERVLHAARDFSGKRPLFIAAVAGGIAVASSVRSLLVHPNVPHEFNLAHIAEATAFLWTDAFSTSYRAIEDVGAGYVLAVRAGEAPTRVHRWKPVIREDRNASFGEGAIELRRLLVAASAERMRGVDTSVTLSGGYDSSAVYASAMQAHREHGFPVPQSISMSYPPGDPGREDELIETVHAHWGTAAQWVDVARVDLMAGLQSRARERDDAWAHAFEEWNRELLAGARANGARVVFDGGGGDLLFAASPLYLADLFRRGHWLRLLAEMRAFEIMTPRGFKDFVLRHAVPSRAIDWYGRSRGRRILHLFERPVPSWIRTDFAATHALADRQRLAVQVDESLPRGAWEIAFGLASPFTPRIYSEMARFGVASGVHMRSPMWDRRVIEFSARRPSAERALGHDSKRLLRASMKHLLPDAFLAPRTERTGTTAGILAAAVRDSAPVVTALGTRGWILGDLGILDPSTIVRALEEARRTNDLLAGGGLLSALRVEAWLQSSAL